MTTHPGYSEESSKREGSFEHPKHMFKLKGKKILINVITNLISKMFCLTEPIV